MGGGGGNWKRADFGGGGTKLTSESSVLHAALSKFNLNLALGWRILTWFIWGMGGGRINSSWGVERFFISRYHILVQTRLISYHRRNRILFLRQLDRKMSTKIRNRNNNTNGLDLFSYAKINLKPLSYKHERGH